MLRTTDHTRSWLSRLLEPVRRRPSADRGIALALTALLIVAMLGATSLVVDLGMWQIQASKIQKAADAAALAAVTRLPDGDAAAIALALEVAAANGYDDLDPDIDVAVTVLDSEVIEVSITNSATPQFFSAFFRDSPDVNRRSTAQYVQPVRLGSPRNYLGTGGLLTGLVTGDGVENFWLSASGPCTRREYGDRIAVQAMAIPATTPYNCATAGGGRKANPEYQPTGYVFGVTVPDANAGADVHIQMFDAPNCGGLSLAGDESAAPFNTQVVVRKGDDLDPLAGTLVSDRTFVGRNSLTPPCLSGAGPAAGGAECPAPAQAASCWTTLATVSESGDYFVQVKTLFTTTAVDSRHNNFSFRAKRNSTFVPCTSDPAAIAATPPASPPYDATCSQVYGFEHLPVFANIAATDPVFFLSSVDERHNGKKMEVTLYDAAEGGTGIQLIDPSGNPATFTWQVLCANGAKFTGACADGEATPTGGWIGPSPVTVLNVAGSGTKTFVNNTQNGKYSDRMVQLLVDLPDDIDTFYGGRTWWKIRYTGSFSGDRTTWSVRLLGDPVRLLPNS